MDTLSDGTLASLIDLSKLSFLSYQLNHGIKVVYLIKETDILLEVQTEPTLKIGSIKWFLWKYSGTNPATFPISQKFFSGEGIIPLDFEEALNLMPKNIQQQILFNLDLFR